MSGGDCGRERVLVQAEWERSPPRANGESDLGLSHQTCQALGRRVFQRSEGHISHRMSPRGQALEGIRATPAQADRRRPRFAIRPGRDLVFGRFHPFGFDEYAEWPKRRWALGRRFSHRGRMVGCHSSPSCVGGSSHPCLRAASAALKSSRFHEPRAASCSRSINVYWNSRYF